MPEYVTPGTFIQEVERGARPIEGVSTSVTAFLGETQRGPIRPAYIDSDRDYARIFGGSVGGDGYMAEAIAGFFANGGKRACICRIVGVGATTARRALPGLDVEARGPGAWGNRVFVKLTESTTVTDRFRLQVAYWEEATSDGLYPDPFDPSGTPSGTLPITEDFDGLTSNDPASASYYAKRLENASAFIVLKSTSEQLTPPVTAAFGALAGGTDGLAPTVEDYRGLGETVDARKGLSAIELDPYREVALVIAPGADNEVVSAVIEHCEQSRFRFAVVDAERGQAASASIDPRARWDTTYAAYYYPWIFVPDPQTGAPRLIPPSGHVAGVFARTDTERGVWKAPANELLRGVVDLEFHVGSEAQNVLNPRGVNVIRHFPGRGIRVWGARTLSTDSLWKYVSVRRLFVFLERSIYESTQWVIFEPNDDKLWARLRDEVRSFLRNTWRDGALAGRKEEQAFFIKCDRSTMTQDDILNGRLICEIGIAPVRPAEFIIFRVFQNTAESRA